MLCFLNRRSNSAAEGMNSVKKWIRLAYLYAVGQYLLYNRTYVSNKTNGECNQSFGDFIMLVALSFVNRYCNRANVVAILIWHCIDQELL